MTFLINGRYRDVPLVALINDDGILYSAHVPSELINSTGPEYMSNIWILFNWFVAVYRCPTLTLPKTAWAPTARN